MDRRRFCVTLAAALLLAGCGRGSGDPTVSDAWVRLPAVPGRPGAAYFTLAGGARADRLTAVESAAVHRAELHEGGMMAGMATMRPMSGVDLPAGGHVAFAPGGNHVMLFGVDQALKPGRTIPLRLRFASGTSIATTATLVAAGDPAPAP